MRDKKLIAEHRGGELGKDHHRLLMKWAVLCAEHVLPLFGEVIDERLINALSVAKEWANENTSAGRAIKASLGAHAAAREAASPVSVAVARSVGQAVATAHMADHSIGAAIYALKAVKIAGQSVDAERKWQNEHLPSETKEMVLALRAAKEGSEHKQA